MLISNLTFPISHRLAQSQNQENIIKSENYIFNLNTDSNLIIGTSLSSRIVFKYLNNTSDLTLSGLSIYDGINILFRTNKKPKKIFIESNFIFKNMDDNFSNDLFSNPNFYLKKSFSFLRENNKPILKIGSFLSKNPNSKYFIKFS